MTARRGRPPHPDVLTPAEWRVLEHLRLGRTNAEIAVRTGVSVNTVRFHVSNMLGKVGANDRRALAAWQGRPRRNWLAWPAWLGVPASAAARGAAVLAGAALVAAVALLGPSPGGGDLAPPPQHAEAVASPTAVPAAAAVRPLDEDAGYRAYTADELEAAGMVDVGRLFTVMRHPYPLAVMSYRADLAAVRIAGDAVAQLPANARGGPGDVGVIGGAESSVTLAVSLDGRQYTVRIIAADSLTRFLAPGVDTFTVYGRVALPPGTGDDERRPTLSVHARDDHGARYATAIDARGNLFIAREPLSDDLIIDYMTGVALDASSAMRFGSLEDTPTGVYCAERPACSLTHYFTEDFELPVAGTLVCESAQAMSFHAEAFSIALRGPMGGGGVHEACIGGGESTELAAGDALELLGWWNFNATTADGEPLSFGADGRGNIYLGVEPPPIGCPCRPVS